MSPCEEIRQFWISKFHARGEELIPFFVNSTLSKRLWLEKYKELQPIEKMPEQEKKRDEAICNKNVSRKNNTRKIGSL